MKIFHNYLLVAEGRLGNSPQPRNFVLDTGTSPSIINVTVANQLGIPTKSSTLADIGQIIPTQAATIPEIALGPVRAVSLPVQVENLSRLESDLGIPIAGILGLDVLSKSSFQLDYDKGQIAFGGISPEGIPVQFDAQSAIAVAKVKIDGRATRMLVDTGTDRVVLFGGNFADLAWLSPRDTSQRGRSLVNREMPVQVFSAPDIVVGERHFSKERAYLVPGSTDPAFDGLLGVRALGFRGLSYDQTCGTIFLLS
ncbi:MAG: retropepsin-like domain-containing protein [Acidobacteriia bacterium]|nr:retropepsin-like domain-containing protein [Terriglobia bacterium]